MSRFFYSPIVRSVGALLVGVGIGFLIPHRAPAPDNQVTRLGGYNYINPLVSCDLQEDVPYAHFGSLEQALQQQINDAQASGDITRASVYFRDMNTGYWTGVNENTLYIPASLLKVPLLIAYLRESESNPGVLQKVYTLPASPDNNAVEYFKPKQPLALGGSYSVEELLAAMIEQSDNNAAAVLLSNVSTSSIDDVYQSFGLPITPNLANDSISPAEYMRVFRILYNATYLDRSNSQTALKMLSAIDFSQGAIRGLPAGIPFSNKFGERTVTTQNSSGVVVSTKKQLADCGIVYYPGNPYGICIMTEGSDFSKLSDTIAALSLTVYTAVDGGLLSQ